MWRWRRAGWVGTGFPVGCVVQTVSGFFYLVFCCVPTPWCGSRFGTCVLCLGVGGGYWWFGLFLGLPVVFGCWLVSCGCGFGGGFVAEGAVAGAVVGAAFGVWCDVVGFDAVGLSGCFVVEVGVAAGAVFDAVVFGLLYEAGSVA